MRMSSSASARKGQLSNLPLHFLMSLFLLTNKQLRQAQRGMLNAPPPGEVCQQRRWNWDFSLIIWVGVGFFFDHGTGLIFLPEKLF